MNNLYPIFLKVHQIKVLIVGAGFVGHEKLFFLLKSSPNAQVTIVAKEIGKDVQELAEGKNNIILIKDEYKKDYLEGKQLVIGATNFIAVNHQIYDDAKAKNILVNIADTPDYCDFYLGGIVTKGDVKIAISTNGQSPTLAKRLRQFFEEVIPEDIHQLASNLNLYRKQLGDDLNEKVQKMNELTKGLTDKEE